MYTNVVLISDVFELESDINKILRSTIFYIQSTLVITTMFVLCLYCCYNEFAGITNFVELLPIIK